MIHLVLISFVKICVHVVKHRQGSKSHRAMNFTRGDPKTLRLELSTFKNLLQAQCNVEGPLTFSKIATIEEKTKTIQDAVEETRKDLHSLSSDATRLKALATIRDTFGVPTTMALDATATQAFTDITNKCADKSRT
ncbi:hypothetical protein CORC01_00015 [Colletotrichum orchidophilum]|uniref:Uncharacterized protein n=1 Tax=Colletotrichum orchidophilum TaxID=1209926 RepID=A0A1G4BSY2_9PEZI|nr:uncharacterized protein CORC01_00015 [Colletotrichum orchidophilum]OHF04544.1 hypothetical protein CORC01_00015 [Colletotrichum orchidophilum]